MNHRSCAQKEPPIIFERKSNRMLDQVCSQSHVWHQWMCAESIPANRDLQLDTLTLPTLQSALKTSDKEQI